MISRIALVVLCVVMFVGGYTLGNFVMITKIQLPVEQAKPLESESLYAKLIESNISNDEKWHIIYFHEFDKGCGDITFSKLLWDKHWEYPNLKKLSDLKAKELGCKEIWK